MKHYYPACYAQLNDWARYMYRTRDKRDAIVMRVFAADRTPSPHTGHSGRGILTRQQQWRRAFHRITLLQLANSLEEE
jgi:hypothetical protein